MTAVDTNVLVRLLTGDDPRQTAVARSLFSTETIWIAKTVLLETAWVLRARYGYDSSAIGDAFKSLLGLDNVQVEDEASIIASLSLISHGVDIVDAMHLTSRPLSTPFVSFDRSFVRRAQRAGVSDIAELSPRS